MEEPEKSRAKFDADVQIVRVTANYANGRAENYRDEDARAFGLKLVDRPNQPISAMQFLLHTLKRYGPSPLHAVPNRALALAAHHGQSESQGTQLINITDYKPGDFPTSVHDELIVSLEIDYKITVRRLSDT